MNYRWPVLLVLLLSGCSMSRQTETLEAYLREQETQLSSIHRQLQQTEADLAAARQESQLLRSQLTSSGKAVIPPEQAELFYRLSGIQFDTMQTSFLPGEAAGTGEFTVFITPVDQFQTALRIPGEIQISVLSATDSEPRTLAHTTFPANQVQGAWTAGWVSSGFVLQLPWTSQQQAQLNDHKVLLEATFKTIDGRNFTARHPVTLPSGGATPTALQTVPVAAEPPLLETPASPQIVPANFLDVPPAPASTRPSAIDTSDRRTIDEFPKYR